jgi:hypothetical protein
MKASILTNRPDPAAHAATGPVPAPGAASQVRKDPGQLPSSRRLK